MSTQMKQTFGLSSGPLHQSIISHGERRPPTDWWSRFGKTCMSCAESALALAADRRSSARVLSEHVWLSEA